MELKLFIEKLKQERPVHAYSLITEFVGDENNKTFIRLIELLRNEDDGFDYIILLFFSKINGNKHKREFATILLSQILTSLEKKIPLDERLGQCLELLESNSDDFTRETYMLANEINTDLFYYIAHFEDSVTKDIGLRAWELKITKSVSQLGRNLVPVDDYLLSGLYGWSVCIEDSIKNKIIENSYSLLSDINKNFHTVYTKQKGEVN